jgi:hypothetical protein
MEATVENREKMVIEAYQRVQAFLVANPAPAPATYADSEKILDGVVARLSEHASTQRSGLRLGQAEREKQRTLMRKLREQHLRPIVAIGKSAVDEMAGIEQALKMPSADYGVVKLLADATAIAEAATKYEPVFVTRGRPADFLAQLKAAIDELRVITTDRATLAGRRVGARAGIGEEIRRGRKAVEVLDSIVRAAFVDNEVVLARWQVAKQLHSLPGGTPAAQTTAAAPTATAKTSAA